MKESLGNKIKFFRKKKGYTQFELELEIGLSQGAISRIESGKVNPTKETIMAIAKVLDLSDTEKALLFDINFVPYSILSSPILDMFLIYDINILFKKIFELSKELLHVNMAIVCFWEKNEKNLYVVDTMLPNKLIKLVRLVTKKIPEKLIYPDLDDKNIFIRSIKDKRVIITDNIYDTTRPIISRKNTLLLQKIVKLKKAISIPLIVGNEAFGIFSVAWEKDIISSTDLDLLENWGKHISIAIHNAQLMQKN